MIKELESIIGYNKLLYEDDSQIIAIDREGIKRWFIIPQDNGTVKYKIDLSYGFYAYGKERGKQC